MTMTAPDAGEVEAAEAAPRTGLSWWVPRRTWLCLIAALVLLCASVIALVVRHHDDVVADRTYGPIRAGNFWATEPGSAFTFGKDDENPRLTAPTGQLITALRNDGSHPVVVSAVDGPIFPERHGRYPASPVQWSVYAIRNGDYVTGENRPWHSFPATIPAHGTIRLRITIHPTTDCVPPYSISYSGGVTVHWRSLLHAYVTEIDTYDGGDDLHAIEVC